MNETMNLMEALQVIANAGLTVVSSTGEVKAKPKKKIQNRRSKGTGSIINLGAGRKKPFGALVTLGYDDETGRQIQKYIGYYKTREEAQMSLELYNMQHKGFIDNKQVSVSTKNNCPTVKEIWEKLSENELSHLSKRGITNYTVSFNHFEDLHERKINTITLADIQPYFDDLMNKSTGLSKMNNMKIVLNQIFKYALKYDYIEKNYANFIQFRETLEEEDKKKKIPFTIEQIKTLIKNDDDLIVQSILIMIFTGMRPSELLKLKKENIHLKERYMIGGIKTKSGIDRVIPIHEMIVKYIDNLSKHDLPSYYQSYLLKFNEVKEKYNFKCTPHSGRHTFATLAKLCNMNEFARKKIMGHASNDLTDDVYTHAPIQFLIDEVNKIKIND